MAGGARRGSEAAGVRVPAPRRDGRAALAGAEDGPQRAETRRERRRRAGRGWRRAVCRGAAADEREVDREGTSPWIRETRRHAVGRKSGGRQQDPLGGDARPRGSGSPRCAVTARRRSR